MDDEVLIIISQWLSHADVECSSTVYKPVIARAARKCVECFGTDK